MLQGRAASAPGLGTNAAICWAGRERPGARPAPQGAPRGWEGGKGAASHTTELYRNVHPHSPAICPVSVVGHTSQVKESLHKTSLGTYDAPGLVALGPSPSLAQQGRPAPWVDARV